MLYYYNIRQKPLHQLNSSCFLQMPSKECEPYRMSEGLPIAPCGAIANSLFNGKCDTVNNFTFFFPAMDCCYSRVQVSSDH